ncbi:antibiotic biosynthesis monooxygenase [Flavobacteriaceae bacterium TP-CH-4]|uniref:Antibiotic biosynthesis monooxygenase n=1 Tax=Pelagihabitans pacificus TaxID=2696054 RepID=A0A967AQK5_9FLAO|nr:antibiotic biosynthesis monooxygenase family protein [Pelagihabitans pacificus]NHF58523.1 antibiotic biosynthesis monooxygenase [Pelagihabitans pacificus]
MKKVFYIIICTALFIQCSPRLGFTNLENNTSYGLHGKLTAKEGKGQELSSILLEAAKLMESAKGCRLYAVGVDKTYPNEVWVTEIWDNKQAHDNSLNVLGVKELIGKAIPILKGSPQKGKELEVIGGLGIR